MACRGTAFLLLQAIQIFKTEFKQVLKKIKKGFFYQSHDKIIPLLHRIIEVPGSNLSPENGYPDCGLSWFSSVHTDKCRDNTLN
jgi:hypothetical protein